MNTYLRLVAGNELWHTATVPYELPIDMLEAGDNSSAPSYRRTAQKTTLYFWKPTLAHANVRSKTPLETYMYLGNE